VVLLEPEGNRREQADTVWGILSLKENRNHGKGWKVKKKNRTTRGREKEKKKPGIQNQPEGGGLRRTVKLTVWYGYGYADQRKSDPKELKGRRERKRKEDKVRTENSIFESRARKMGLKEYRSGKTKQRVCSLLARRRIKTRTENDRRNRGTNDGHPRLNLHVKVSRRGNGKKVIVKNKPKPEMRINKRYGSRQIEAICGILDKAGGRTRVEKLENLQKES